MRIKECGKCGGVGQYTPHNAGEEHDCFTCKGLGRVNRDGYYFRSERGMKQAKYSRVCDRCDGTGKETWPLTMGCLHCSRTGKIIEELFPGDRFPVSEVDGKLDRCAWAEKEAWAKFVDSCEVIVGREDRDQTWFESYIGPLRTNGFYSCTDYGRMWDNPKSADWMKSTIREHPEQWINVLDENNIALGTIVVAVNRGGYSVFATRVKEGNV